jgi:branched-chain amino acid transport system substrate-binding protein
MTIRRTMFAWAAAAVLAAPLALSATPAVAQGPNEQYIPNLVYRTGPYAPNGIPFANGVADYYNLINERDGGINGVRIALEECEFGYDTARGVECYERTKNKGATGAALVLPLSTGVTFALIERSFTDKIPIVTMGYGRSETVDGRVFPYVFPLLGTYWDGADILITHIANELGGANRLRGKKVTLVYHDSPYGKEPIAWLEVLAKKHGFQFSALPVTHPGIEQKATWLQIRQSRPDFVLLWGWGVMNATAIKEAQAVNFPRDKMYGIWWAGAEQDVIPSGEGAKGYKAAILHPSGAQFGVTKDILARLHDRNRGAGAREDVGQVLYNRGMVNAMLNVEAIRTAMGRFGNKPLTGEQVAWGFENLNLTAQRIEQLGFTGLIEPIRVNCADHGGSRRGAVHQWDGKQWVLVSNWIESDVRSIRPMMDEAAAKFAREKNMTPRDCARLT